jgi:hypothetical protein
MSKLRLFQDRAFCKFADDLASSSKPGQSFDSARKQESSKDSPNAQSGSHGNADRVSAGAEQSQDNKNEQYEDFASQQAVPPTEYPRPTQSAIRRHIDESAGAAEKIQGSVNHPGIPPNSLSVPPMLPAREEKLPSLAQVFLQVVPGAEELFEQTSAQSSPQEAFSKTLKTTWEQGTVSDLPAATVALYHKNLKAFGFQVIQPQVGTQANPEQFEMTEEPNPAPGVVAPGTILGVTKPALLTPSGEVVQGQVSVAADPMAEQAPQPGQPQAAPEAQRNPPKLPGKQLASVAQQASRRP